MLFALFLAFCTAALIGYAVVPPVYNKSIAFSQKRTHTLTSKLDRVLPKTQVQKLAQIYMIAPLGTAALMYVLFPEEYRLIGVVFGFVGGFFFPSMYTKILILKNKAMFDDQLVDALMIMSSSFRGGLSLIQAMEAVVEEMPDPMNQEILTVLGENKMGVSLEESLTHLYNRMTSTALQQVITAILLARETGGNLPAIFTRIVNNIREQKKIQQQIDTLTLQGKIQGVVMSMLPVAFFMVIYSTNPYFFNHMFESDMGRALLIYAAISEVVGAFMIWKISTFRDY
ncbi:MAG: type II secretion system F family protein [Candidatus Omnitrophota bacterium]|nr:type II secretion system F family protein [Candidatus Omnitrophota bacterium]MDZ4241960.1 type II secretion system F family protein [Candidatus Omnitrophota bacterium]